MKQGWFTDVLHTEGMVTALLTLGLLWLALLRSPQSPVFSSANMYTADLAKVVIAKVDLAVSCHSSCLIRSHTSAVS